MSNLVKITVVIPAYNVEKYIGKTIESVLNQTFDSYEVIVVDDGSKDKTGIICDEYAADNSRLKVVHQDNGGVMSARLKGVEYANGEWISFLDGDDRLPQDSLEELYACISDKIDVVWGDSIFIDEDGNNIKVPSSVCSEGEICISLYKKLISGKPIALHGLLFRKTLFNEPIIIDRRVVNNEDQIYNLFLSGRIRRVYKLNKVIHHYLIRQDGVSSRKFSVDYWYFVFQYVKDNYLKYGLEQKFYELYILTRISSLVRAEGCYDFDYTHSVFKNLKQLSFSLRRSRYENWALLIMKYPTSLVIKLSRFHPSKYLHKWR